jgi:glycogen operon protein
METMRAWPGRPYPLGATWDGAGVNFALFSEHASGVELCLFDRADAGRPTATVRLRERTEFVWHVYVPDVRPGQFYGYRVDGRWEPEEGLRFNRDKLLLDPYARAISGVVRSNDVFLGYDPRGGPEPVVRSPIDSAGAMPKSIVVETAFSWDDDKPPRVPWNRTVLYECHVRGMTMLHPGVDESLRGTYLGLASEPILEHLTSLGVTAVELLPVHHFVDEAPLVKRSLRNYWGYNSIGFFAPEARYATGSLGQQVAEFKTMVKRFHRAGIEVILDVVFNHTGEGDHRGPTLSLRGIDNPVYYRLDPARPRHYVDFTGCGNSLNLRHPRVLQLVMDSLRYWVTDMHVDGFRFDLAPVLGREERDFDRFSGFFDVIQQDPLLSQVKLIAEPWDLGPGGYQVGGFPAPWSEWNDKYRDTVRRFWRGDEGVVPELASRLSGSSDLFQVSDRGPSASINFVTCHDGFTLNDLVSYERKHNRANGENNRDGTDDNQSRNWGHEGETSAPSIVRMRERMQRNFLATLLFSQGVPMLSHGDELGRTQRGNNNAYCQDNEIAWVDWKLDERGRRFLDFARRLIAILREHPSLRRRRFFRGTAEDGVTDVVWLRRDGAEMTAADWRDPANHVLGMLVTGTSADEYDDHGRPLRSETLLLLVNGGNRSRQFSLPRRHTPGVWHELVDTVRPGERLIRTPAINLVAHSLVLLRYAAAKRGEPTTEEP